MRLGTFYRSCLLRRLGEGRVRGRALDIGGFDGYWVASLPDVRPFTIDVDPEPMYPGVSYVRGDALRLPFRDGMFDVVFAVDLIEHVSDEKVAIEEAIRVLRPGGRIVLTTPSDRIAVFPRFLQPWVNKRWGHDRVPGFGADYLQRIFAGHSLTSVRVLPLAQRALRGGYIFLSVAWRLPGPIGRWMVRLAAAIDARFLVGERGAVLVTATR